MREIKFRIWNKRKKEWMFGYNYPDLGGFNLLGEVVLFGEIQKVELEELKDIIVMQYTRIKDKNGKEIYEGDIVRCVYKDCEGGGWYTKYDIEKGEVYLDEFWGVKFDCTDKTQRTADYWKRGTTRDVSDIEVIGNIHENPELLEEG